MANPAGESESGVLHLDFDRRLQMGPVLPGSPENSYFPPQVWVHPANSGLFVFVNERKFQMAKNEDDPARVAILQEWDAWAQWHPREAKMAGGMPFFTYLQKERSDLLLDFKAPGDEWKIVHSWLLRERKVKS